MLGHHILEWFTRFGYLGLALGVLLESAGLPVPGETALLAAGFAAAGGALQLPLVMAVAALSSILGDNAGYMLGRRLGRSWLERHGHRILLTPRRLRRMDAFFERFGAASIAIARFVAGVRVIAALSAGIARVPWKKFLLFNVVGAVAWAVVISGLGYGAGKGWSAIPHLGGRVGVGIVAVVVAVAAVSLLFRHLRSVREAILGGEWIRLLVWEWVGVLASTLAAVLLVAKVVEDVAEQESTAFDASIRAFALTHRARILTGFFEVMTWVGAPVVLVPLTILLAAVLWRRTGKRFLAAVLVAPIGGGGLFLLLKQVFQRTRPYGPGPHHLLSYSFPSGHATVSAAVAFTTAYVLSREEMVSPVRTALIALLFVIAVGLSRVYLDVHWATDVLGGWAVGLLVATLSAALYERLRDEPLPFLWRERRHPTTI